MRSYRSLEKQPVPPTPAGFADILPLELTTKIFWEACNIPHRQFLRRATTSSEYLKTLTTPFVLSTICRKWRRITWTTPQVWNSVYAVVSTRRFTQQLAQIQTWIERSEPHPLELTVHLDDDVKWTRDEECAAQLFSTLARASHRWRAITSNIPAIAYKSLASITEPMPFLTSCNLRLFSHDADDEECPPPPFLVFAPSLQCLELREYQALPSTFPWDNLTDLTFTYTTHANFTTILSALPNLRSLCLLDTRFAALEHTPDESKPIPRIKLASLHTLTFYNFQWPALDIIFKSLDLPALTLLQLSTLADKPHFPRLADYLTSCGALASLRQMTLFNVLIETDTDGFIALMRQLPAMEDLEIEFHPNVNEKTYCITNRLVGTDKAPDLLDVPVVPSPAISIPGTRTAVPLAICPYPYVLPNLNRIIVKGPTGTSDRCCNNDLFKSLEKRWFHSEPIPPPTAGAGTKRRRSPLGVANPPCKRLQQFIMIDDTEYDENVVLAEEDADSGEEYGVVASALGTAPAVAKEDGSNKTIATIRRRYRSSGLEPVGLQLLRNLKARGMNIHVVLLDDEGRYLKISQSRLLELAELTLFWRNC